jgi:very-short-patch-repair endonuclease
MSNPSLITALVLLAVVVAAGVVIAAAMRRQPDRPWPLYERKPMSVPEQVLYFRLRESLPDHIVLAQVQLSRFLGVKKGHPRRRWLNRIDRKSVDFLILKKDASVVAAIELDDSSHDRPERRVADENKDKALESSGVRLLRFRTGAMPAGDQIQQLIVGPPNVRGNDGREELGLVEPPTSQILGRHRQGTAGSTLSKR